MAMCSLRGIVQCGIFLAVFDMLHGLATFGFYGYEFVYHYRCHWNHGIRWCQYYLYDTNHSVRVNIGIAEGLACVFFASLFIFSLIKYRPMLAWAWLAKALIVVALNMYFIGDWLVKQSRYYHSYWDPYEVDQDNLFLYTGVGLTLMECVLMFVFCCVSATFMYKVRKELLPTVETDI